MRPGFDSRRPERNGARRSEVRGERANCFARVRESKAGACRFATARRGRDLRGGALAKQKSCDRFLDALSK